MPLDDLESMILSSCKQSKKPFEWNPIKVNVELNLILPPGESLVVQTESFRRWIISCAFLTSAWVRASSLRSVQSARPLPPTPYIALYFLGLRPPIELTISESSRV